MQQAQREALKAELRGLLSDACPMHDQQRRLVVEETAKALGLTAMMRAMSLSQFRTDDLEQLSTAQLNRLFEFLRVASEALTHADQKVE
ncbi:MAG: hypothetical protein RIB45_15285 [Marivibrio sp.]|uniref:hypothetical protein n=1 Tax=Marivibrio sp. TaxID=2039719 RepID=UPI0032EC30D9